MAKTAAFKGLMTGCLLLASGVDPAWSAPPSVEMMLTNPSCKPDFADIQISTPASDEYGSCEVKLITGVRPKSSGWMLLDAKKQPLRRFFSNDGAHLDTWSYYKDGVEVYREIDGDFNGKKDQYRWLNTGGMKWGYSTLENGKIDVWKYISAEEAGQEVFAALATNDLARLKALFITQAEMRNMKLPPEEAQRMIGLLSGAAVKFQATRAKLPQLNAKAHFVRVESATANCMPAETNGTDQDQLRFPYRSILFATGDKDMKHDWVQTGEMIKVGMAWRLIDGPSPQEMAAAPSDQDPALQKLFDALAALDARPPAPQLQPKADQTVQDYNVQRVAIIQKVLEHVKGPDREMWIKQILDNLSAAYQAGNDNSLKQLAYRRDEITKEMAGSNLAAYATYRELWARYAAKLAGPMAAKIQEEWLDQLAKFAQAYPKADDTPDALWQLGMGSEYSGKDEEAKSWYRHIYQNFPSHPLAAKAKGCETRLDLIGQPLALSGPQLGSNANFDIASLKGKVVVVYYWASTVSVCERDFDSLKRLRAKHADKMELVTVNLDDTAAAALAFVHKAQIPGIHLFKAASEGGGLNSPLATMYGINSMPHLFLVGRDGHVLNRTLQVADLETELVKALP